MTVYGAEVPPNGPQQDMWAFDDIAGVFPPREREDPPNDFTGGIGPMGIGGQAEGLDTSTGPSEIKDRIGF
jgi:hypothetical protein